MPNAANHYATPPPSTRANNRHGPRLALIRHCCRHVLADGNQRIRIILFYLFKHQRQRAEATDMPVKSVQ